MATQDSCCTVVPYFKAHPGALTIADLTRLEIHGPEPELARLRAPLAQFKPQFFVLEYGFRR
jgi:hypothetical protein